MIITEDVVDLATKTGMMRARVFRPAAAGKYPGLILFSEIFQITGPIQRSARMMASNGYIVVVPEIFHEFEPMGTAFPYTQEGTDKGVRYKNEKEQSAFDSDARATIDYLMALPNCTGRLGCLGFCIGGRLSFRCAMNPEILAASCFYASDIHKQPDTMEHAAKIQGELLMIWGRQDPVIPQEGRELVYRRLIELGRNFTWHEFNAEHAFMRDEGNRYNAALAQICYAMTLEMFSRTLQLSESTTETETRH